MNEREEVRALVEAYVSAYNARDWTRFRKIVADDGVLNELGFRITRKGGEDWTEGFRNAADRVPDRHLTVERMLIDGDTAVLELTWKGTPAVEAWGLPPGRTYTMRACSVMTVRGGRILSTNDYTITPLGDTDAI